MNDYNSWAEFVDQNPDRVADQTEPGATGPLSERTDAPTESMIQQDVIRWARRNEDRYVGLKLLHSIPNEGFADLPGVTAANRVAMGVVSGMPDLHIPVASGRFSALWLELKRPGNDLNPNQYRRLKQLHDYGNAVEVAWSAEQAIFVITHYLESPEFFLSGY